MTREDFTLPDLEARLGALAAGAVCQISRHDYERLFGHNDAALGRLRGFARSHGCVASFAPDAVLFRRHIETEPDPQSRGAGP